jgi:pimeloyl-ACP methyl ester carboxylesterase
MKFIDVAGQRLEFVRLASSHPREGAPTLVFLHEGLGSVAMWRDFPQRVADATGCAAVVYSRHGHGRSSELVGRRWPSYMHDEALIALPALLDALGIDAPILFGHSDGGSIALIHAAASARAVTALVLMAPHIFVEDLSVASIARAGEAYRTTDLPARLARYHAHVDSMFRGWNDIWLAPEFRDWNIESLLPAIGCPVLAIQGEDDEYGTMAQIDGIAAAVADVELVKLADCRHSPHKDQPAAVIEAVAGFVERLLDERDATH